MSWVDRDADVRKLPRRIVPLPLTYLPTKSHRLYCTERSPAHHIAQTTVHKERSMAHNARLAKVHGPNEPKCQPHRDCHVGLLLWGCMWLPQGPAQGYSALCSLLAVTRARSFDRSVHAANRNSIRSFPIFSPASRFLHIILEPLP